MATFICEQCGRTLFKYEQQYYEANPRGFAAWKEQALNEHYNGHPECLKKKIMKAQQITITKEQLVNEQGSGYGWSYTVNVPEGTAEHEGLEALAKHLNYEDWCEMQEYLHDNHTYGLWNQIRFQVICNGK